MFEFLKAGTSLRYDFDMKDLFLKSHTWLELSYGQSYDLSDRLTKLNHNLVLGLAVPLAPRGTCDR